jgi:hypothetical protein
MSLQTLFKTKLTDTWTDAKDGEPVGTIRWELDSDDNQCCYKCVLYDDGTGNLDLAVGDVVGYVSDTGYGAHTVCADADGGRGTIGAGVSMAAVTVDATYFWVQIKGPATIAEALTGGSDNNALTCAGAGDKTLDVSNAVTDAVVAFAVDADQKEIICDFPF